MPENSLKKLPLDIRVLIFSDELGTTLAEICFNNKIEDEEKQKEIARQVGNVLVGVLPQEKFIDALKKEINLTSIVAVKIASEIEHRIFSTVKKSLASLYKKEGESFERPLITPPEVKPEVKPEVEPSTPPSKKPVEKPNVYRESIK